jgi:pimeloyl-ACP methyl ester carboxylesterase
VPDISWFTLDDGARMPWIEFGPADGTPVIIVPGLTDGLGPVSEPAVAGAIHPPPAEWSQVRVLVVSHRHPMDGVTTASLAADLAAFCDGALDQPPALIAAHSMGAMVAMHLAVKRPELAPRLVLSAPAAAPDDELARHLEHWAELVTVGNWEAFARAACETAYTGQELERRLAAIDVFGPPPGTHLAERHLALTKAALDHDAMGLLEEVLQPTLLLGGTDDPVVTPDAVRRVHELMPNTEIAWFWGMAHGFPEQDRGAYLSALRSFLADTPVEART